MSVPNKQMRQLCFKYESERGTKAITSSADDTETFGKMIAETVKVMQIKAKTNTFYAYSKREPSFISSILELDQFTLPKFIPTTMQWLYLYLGKFEEGESFNTIESLDEGLKPTATIHFEDLGGTNEEIRDMIGAEPVEIDFTLEVGKPMIVNSMKFEGLGIETKNYYKTDPSVKLSKDSALREYEKPFIGISEIRWDAEGDNIELANCWRIDVASSQDYSASLYDLSDKRKSGYSGIYKPHHAIFYCVLQGETQYNDLLSQKEIGITALAKKADTSKYAKFYFNKSMITEISKVRPIGGGYYESEILVDFCNLKAEFLDGIESGEDLNAAYNVQEEE